jgi:hypothetical protein
VEYIEGLGGCGFELTSGKRCPNVRYKPEIANPE